MGSSFDKKEARVGFETLLWYENPAKDWNEALPLGNGRLGAMVFGGVEKELYQLNDDTFWAGYPHNYSRPGASNHLEEIRRLIFEGKELEATTLADRTFMGDPPFQAAFQPLGDLVLQFKPTPVDAYSRELDLLTGIHTVSYELNEVQFVRESLISNRDQVLAVRLTASKPGQISFTVGLHSLFTETVETSGNEIVLRGRWRDDGLKKDWTASWSEPGMRSLIATRILADGGQICGNESELSVQGADSVVILLTTGTSFVNYQSIDGNEGQLFSEVLDAAEALGFDALEQRHYESQQQLMGLVTLSLPRTEYTALPTNQRVDAVQKGVSDPSLAALYFNYGRYLLISSSRPGTQAANLQGIWNKDRNPAWGSKYTTNINLEMNYWPAEVTNLPECAEPLFDLIDDLMETGSVVARDYYGARGWTLHHNTDLWRGAAPVDGVWGVWPMGSAWLARHAWEHFAFTQDLEFLKDRAWPQMRGAVRFILDFLVKAPTGPFQGLLVTNPSHSPENTFIKPDGTHAQFTYAATMDLEIIRDLFENCIHAIKVLQIDRDLEQEIQESLALLPPLQASAVTGRLMEWAEDYADSEPGHRHMSHLYGLYPGNSISIDRTPELAKAARIALDLRLKNGGGGTGWSRAWLVSLFARLKDGDEAAHQLDLLLAKSTQPNLFDTHPPFQIDGNFAGCAGIAEMLLQSHEVDDEGGYVIELAPAMPSGWRNGFIEGLCTRGGLVVDYKWDSGVITYYRLEALASFSGTLKIGKAQEKLVLNAGEVREFRLQVNDTKLYSILGVGEADLFRDRP